MLVSLALGVVPVLVAAILLHIDQRRDVELGSLLLAADEFEASGWRSDRNIPPVPGEYLSADNLGRAWDGEHGSLIQTMLRYSNTAYARLAFRRYDPKSVYCDPGECSGASNVPVAQTFAADSAEIVCLEDDSVCTKYVFWARYGQYIVEFRTNISLTSSQIAEHAFIGFSKRVDEHINDQLTG